jgi:hypothetical protein
LQHAPYRGRFGTTGFNGFSTGYVAGIPPATMIPENMTSSAFFQIVSFAGPCRGNPFPFSNFGAPDMVCYRDKDGRM